jgi:hypothetical protein
MNVYKTAWLALKERIKTEKTSYGRNELERMMAEEIQQAINDTTD